ncbi:MAG: CvpA family protein [Alphaproteobacteria bacterium]|nr:CvpA family protein [Alphaproteobacteria bacterium]
MLGVIDLIILGIIVISVLFALYRGLVRELLGISSWLLAGFTALYSYDPLLKACDGTFANVKLAAIVGSVLLALLVLIVMTIINAAITRRLRKSSLSGLDRIFGLVFGVARALLIVALIYIFAATMMLSPKYIAEMKEKNRSIEYVEQIAIYIQSVFPENIKADLSAYQTTKKEKMKKRAQKKAIEAVVEYNEKDRETLENMIENIVEIGDIEDDKN